MENSPIHSRFGAAPRVDEILHGSPEYHRSILARDRILRQPLGLQLTAEDTHGEEAQRHFVLRSADMILGGLIAQANEPETIRLRQMWIEPTHSGQGLGRQLLNEVMARLRKEGAGQIQLHAREVVIEFYQKLGFTMEGPRFEEVGIPHRRMTLKLNPETQSPGDHR